MQKGQIIALKAVHEGQHHADGLYVFIEEKNSELHFMQLDKYGVLITNHGTTVVHKDYEGLTDTSLVYDFNKLKLLRVATVNSNNFEFVESILRNDMVRFEMKENCKHKGYVVLNDEKDREEVTSFLKQWLVENGKLPREQQFAEFFKLI